MISSIRLIVAAFFLTAVYSASAQFFSGTKNAELLKPVSVQETVQTSSNTSVWGFVLKADKQTNYRLRFPLLMIRSQSNIFSGETYWAGSITTQSYNHGKLGTFYYWDVQGNLRESKFFFDIAGKNRRGLKLVIPRR